MAPKTRAASDTQVTLTLTLGEQSSDATERDLTLSTDAFNLGMAERIPLRLYLDARRTGNQPATCRYKRVDGSFRGEQ
ncbi:hypothetical protein NXW84_04865 [Bacteroides fragilis]|nr:hypothetical protein NXW84_04865 [Bacteroides fragilis]